MSSHRDEVFTLDELARAAHVPRATLRQLAAAGDLAFIRGTVFISASEALRIGRLVQTLAPPMPPPAAHGLFEPGNSAGASRRVPVLASSAAHLLLLAIVVWLTARPT